MTKTNHHPENERLKHQYFRWLKDARGLGTASVDMAAAAIARFEGYTGYRSFARFHVEQARAFKASLHGARRDGSGKALSSATIASTLRQLKAFFTWLADQPGYRSRIRHSDAAYFSPSAQEVRIAEGRREKPVPSLEEVLAALKAMPANTPIEMRDRAVLAFILLSGGRDGAVASLKLKHVDVDARRIDWDAREVRTKKAKTFSTQFFPVGDAPLAILREWHGYLTRELGFGPDEPLFPASSVELGGDTGVTRVLLSRGHWKTTGPIRAIFKAAFTAVGLRAFNPHSLRSTLAQMGQAQCRTAEEMKAWSQNLGHSQMMTTFASYGRIDTHRQFEIMERLGEPRRQSSAPTEAQALVHRLAEVLGSSR